jgi:hypothetical protein
MHAAGCIYWKYLKGKVLLSLNTVSMEFSRVALPPVPDLYQSQELYVVGDTEDGACCLVCVVSAPSGSGRFSCVLQVWLRVRDEKAGSWELEKEIFSLHTCKLSLSNVRQVCAVTTGVVLFCME